MEILNLNYKPIKLKKCKDIDINELINYTSNSTISKTKKVSEYTLSKFVEFIKTSDNNIYYYDNDKFYINPPEEPNLVKCIQMGIFEIDKISDLIDFLTKFKNPIIINSIYSDDNNRLYLHMCEINWNN